MNEIVEKVCKMSKGYDCCRYLILGTQGFECVKKSPMSYLLDDRVEAGTINARGDNCEGKSNDELNDE